MKAVTDDKSYVVGTGLINVRSDPKAGSTVSIHTDVSATFNTYHCTIFFQYAELVMPLHFDVVKRE